MTQDWSITVNFNAANAPVEARQGQATMGFYKVRCADTTYYPPTDDGKKPFIKLLLSITESAHDASEVGNNVTDRVNVPTEQQSDSARAWTERFLKTTLIGLGHDKAQVAGANGGVTLNSEAFKGREGFMHYEPYNPNDKSSRSNIVWVSEDQYQRGLKGEFKVTLKNVASSSIDTPVAAISATSGFSTTSNGGGMALGTTTPAAPATGIESLLA
jgi:hypothetical protein